MAKKKTIQQRIEKTLEGFRQAAALASTIPDARARAIAEKTVERILATRLEAQLNTVFKQAKHKLNTEELADAETEAA